MGKQITIYNYKYTLDSFTDIVLFMREGRRSTETTNVVQVFFGLMNTLRNTVGWQTTRRRRKQKVNAG